MIAMTSSPQLEWQLRDNISYNITMIVSHVWIKTSSCLQKHFFNTQLILYNSQGTAEKKVFDLNVFNIIPVP